MKQYFIKTQSTLSGLYAVEKRLAKAAQPFSQTLATEQELERIVEYFEDLYEAEKEKNPRAPDISIGLVRYSDKPYFLNIGNYTLSLQEVKPLPECVKVGIYIDPQRIKNFALFVFKCFHNFTYFFYFCKKVEK